MLRLGLTNSRPRKSGKSGTGKPGFGTFSRPCQNGPLSRLAAAGHLLVQPGPRVGPIAMRGNSRDASLFLRLLAGHASKIAQGDELCLDGVLLLQCFERVVER